MSDAGPGHDEVVCGECRLVQNATPRCAGCGAEALVSSAGVAALETTTRRLTVKPRGAATVLDGHGTLGAMVRMTIALYIAYKLASAAFIVLLVLGLAVAGMAANGLVVQRTVRRVLRPVALRRPRERHAVASGVARTCGPPVVAAIAGREALAVSTTVTSARDGKVYFRRREAAELCIEIDDGERVRVSGEVWVDAPATASPSALMRRSTAEMLALVGVPGQVQIDEPLVIDEWAIYPGQPVEAFGVLRREPVAGDDYREHLGLVLRGAPGAPIHLRALGTTQILRFRQPRLQDRARHVI